MASISRPESISWSGGSRRSGAGGRWLNLYTIVSLAWVVLDPMELPGKIPLRSR